MQACSQSNRHHPAQLSALSLSIPVAMGYVPLGSVFGFLLVQAGAVWWLAPLMSIFVFAGSAQFMAVPLLAAGAPLGTLALATFIINLRHVFYGLSLLHRLPQGRCARAYLVWTLTDENYSLFTTLPGGTPAAQMLRIGALNHFWWVLGTLIGALIGAQVSHALAGIDFSLAALFAVLTVEQWRANKQFTPIAIALAAYALACWLVPGQALLASIALSLLAGAAIVRRKRPNPTQEAA